VETATLGLVGAQMPFRTATIAALFLALAASPVLAAPRPEVVINFGPPEANCPSGALRRVTIREILAQPGRFSRKCVRVRGVWAGNALYEDFEAYRRADGTYDVYEPAAEAKPWIGLYAPRDLRDRRGASDPTPIRADMIARVGDCEDLWRGRAIAAGYCRAHEGPYLAVHDADVAPLRLTPD
jgi:hypothetical protein